MYTCTHAHTLFILYIPLSVVLFLKGVSSVFMTLYVRRDAGGRTPFHAKRFIGRRNRNYDDKIYSTVRRSVQTQCRCARHIIHVF